MLPSPTTRVRSVLTQKFECCVFLRVTILFKVVFAHFNFFVWLNAFFIDILTIWTVPTCDCNLNFTAAWQAPNFLHTALAIALFAVNGSYVVVAERSSDDF